MKAALLVSMAAALAAGCATARPAPSLSDPAPDYAALVRERIVAANEDRVHTLRFNPAACGCPPFEVLLGEVWQRVTFDVSDDQDPVLVELRAATAASPRREAGRTWQVQGRLDTSLITCGRGALVVTLRPTALGPEEPPDAEP
ncbi:MAG: hypothetical protein H6744_00755 [Deltaproteobacteria bacterium]|nr:hypothetical protein [Deltaproteobacteria bacterium]MCB9785195.1 hypothetical protein [Deltaproteobacteria bacterium]